MTAKAGRRPPRRIGMNGPRTAEETGRTAGDDLRRMGDRWGPFRAYSLELARTPSVRRANRQLLRELGLRQLPAEEVARIDVPTTLIWGRQDRVMPLAAAPEASVRYGWPLDVIDDAGHFLGVDQPEAFLGSLRRAFDRG